MPTAYEEARAVVDGRLRDLEHLSWEELDLYGTTSEEIETAGGVRLEVESTVRWIGADWESPLELSVRARPADADDDDYFEEDIWYWGAWAYHGAGAEEIPDPPGGGSLPLGWRGLSRQCC
jgi:hypothetical protein